VHGNYLAPSIAAAGMDPNVLPDGDKSTMNFAAGNGSKAKAWKDIWGAGQGVGAIHRREPAGVYIDRLKREYEETRARVMASPFTREVVSRG
jgi:nitronate monooxygenase